MKKFVFAAAVASSVALALPAQAQGMNIQAELAAMQQQCLVDVNVCTASVRALVSRINGAYGTSDIATNNAMISSMIATLSGLPAAGSVLADPIVVAATGYINAPQQVAAAQGIADILRSGGTVGGNIVAELSSPN